MYDVSARHRSDKEEAEMAIEKLRQSNPNDYFLLPKFRELTETIRMANIHINRCEKVIGWE